MNNQAVCVGDYPLLSDETAQQGIPLALCCIVLNRAYLTCGSSTMVQSEVTLMFWFMTFRQRVAELGLIVNESKCELICNDAEAVKNFRKLHLA